jgi:hypothetical protein
MSELFGQFIRSFLEYPRLTNHIAMFDVVIP